MQNAIDLDQAAIEVQLGLKTTAGFAAAKKIYEEGAYSKSYASVMLTMALPAEVTKGTLIDGVAADGSHVEGKALATTAMGSMTIDIQYITNNNQAIYVDCQVGGLPAGLANTNGCFAPSGVITIAGVGTFSYNYAPLTDNNNARTIRGFSTSADSKMLNCPIGCPYPDFQKFYNYYGFADYGDRWVTASIDGTNAGLLNGNADFSNGQGNEIDLRVGACAIQVVIAVCWVWLT